jgi:UDP-glucose 4-epimerase
MFGECLTVTDPNMTRFLMTLDDSVDLIQMTLKLGNSGETWIPRICAMRVGDLADIFSKKYNKPIKIIGLRPGEKEHEDLINESESIRASSSYDKKHYIIGPAFNAGSGKKWTYSSNHDVLTRLELENHLNALGVLETPLSEFKGKVIEEIMTNRKE